MEGNYLWSLATASRIQYFAAYYVMNSMRTLRLVSVALAVTLAAFASAPLFAQPTARSLPSDTVTTASGQGAQPLSTGQDQPQTSNQSEDPRTGIIVGTVTDMNDAPVSGATVSLQGPAPNDVRSVTTNETGFFEIRDVEPGRSYVVSIRAAGFSEWDSSAVALEPGQSKILDVSRLQIQEVQTLVTVTPESSEEIATEEVKTEEKQRGFGIIPNFYAVYTSDPAPLTAKLRFRLALRVARDPFTLGGVAMLAGIGQAANSPRYVQGAKGYGERLGANYANSMTDVMFDGVILPTLLHQDPRYFYKGTGSTRSRVVHALASLLVTKGENGRLQPNYSSVGGDMAAAAISEFYYPRANRGVGLVLQGFAVNTAVHAAVRMLDEFVFHPSGTSPTQSLRHRGGKP